MKKSLAISILVIILVFGLTSLIVFIDQISVEKDLRELIGPISSLSLGLIGIISIFMFIYGLIKMILKRKDPVKFRQVKIIMTSGLILLILVLAVFGYAQFQIHL